MIIHIIIHMNWFSRHAWLCFPPSGGRWVDITDCTILYYTILHYTILYYTILCYAMLCYTILYSTLLYYAIPYPNILSYTILYIYIYTSVDGWGERCGRGPRRLSGNAEATL